MAHEDSHPRRTRKGQRLERGDLVEPKEALHVTAREALDVARYVADMTSQLEAMASSARLELLAYFLGMARAESEMFVRTNAEVGGEGQNGYVVGPDESVISDGDDAAI